MVPDKRNSAHGHPPKHYSELRWIKYPFNMNRSKCIFECLEGQREADCNFSQTFIAFS